MIQFSHRDKKTTQLFSIILWISVGFHIIFGCIQLVYAASTWLDAYEIVHIVDIFGKRYVMAFNQWNVS